MQLRKYWRVSKSRERAKKRNFVIRCVTAHVNQRALIGDPTSQNVDSCSNDPAAISICYQTPRPPHLSDSWTTTRLPTPESSPEASFAWEWRLKFQQEYCYNSEFPTHWKRSAKLPKCPTRLQLAASSSRAPSNWNLNWDSLGRLAIAPTLDCACKRRWFFSIGSQAPSQLSGN